MDLYQIIIAYYYSHQEIFPMPLKKKKQHNPLWCKHTFKAPFKNQKQIMCLFPHTHHLLKPTVVLM